MTTALPVLYSFRRCPYAMRARLALAISEQATEHREVDLRDRPAELYEASAKGTVPVLILPDGRVIDESLEIMLWTLKQNDPLEWLSSSPELHAEALALIGENDGDFKRNLDLYKYASRTPDTNPIEHRELATVFLGKLDEMLSDTSFLFGRSASLADMAIAPFVRQFASADREWFDEGSWTNLRSWLDEFIASSLFASIMLKHPKWQG